MSQKEAHKAAARCLGDAWAKLEEAKAVLDAAGVEHSIRVTQDRVYLEAQELGEIEENQAA